MEDFRITRLSVVRGDAPGEDRIQLLCANGIAGAGEGWWGEAALSRTPELLLGRTPFEAEAIWEDIAAKDSEAGGLDIALWDLAGKAWDLPVARALGKPWREEILVCSADDRPEFVEPEGDVHHLRHIRENSIVPVAAGRACIFRDLLHLVQHKYIDIAIAPLARCGLTGVRRLAYYCWLHRVRGAVACSGSDVSLAAALAGASCYSPVTGAIAAPQPFVLAPANGGTLSVPQSPGLGVPVVTMPTPDFVLETAR